MDDQTHLLAANKFRASIKTKLFLLILLSSMFVSFAAVYLTVSESQKNHFQGLRDELIATARTAAASIDGNKHAKLAISGDEKSPLYAELKDQLKAVKAANPKVRYIYTMVKTESPDVWKFVVDAEDDPKLMSHLGDPYDISPYEEMACAFDKPTADRDITTDKWGDWLSGYAPIYNSNGEAVAIVGLDMSATAVQATIAESRRKLIMPLAFLLLLPAIVGVLASIRASRSITKMIDAAKKIADGNYGYRIHVETGDELGELATALNQMAKNISERVGSIEGTAIIDGLTDLYNHRYFQDRLQEELKRAERYERKLSLMVIDIDSFARFNTINGHVFGDAALNGIAAIIKTCVRDTDIAARYSGEEFAVIMPETDELEALMVAERISMMIAANQFQTKHNIAIPITVSIGMTNYPTFGETGDALVEAAYAALAEAKRRGHNQIASSNELDSTRERVVRLADRLEKSDDAIISAVFSLAKAVDTRDHYTHRHSEFVARYSAALGRALGLDDTDVTSLSIAGLLHDIGKIGVPDAVLNKLDTLTDDEWTYIDRHPALGADIVRHLSGLSEVVKIILHHHEKFDGTGYPDHMRGEEIPYKARVVCIVDAYHAMISDRPYRKGFSHKEAIDELRRCRNTQFDPVIADVFIELMEKELSVYDRNDAHSTLQNPASA